MVIGSAVAYLADAAVETVQTTAKSGDLLNSARRALWVKPGREIAHQRHGCVDSFGGSLLFGTCLEQALSRSTEKGKKFPMKARRIREG